MTENKHTDTGASQPSSELEQLRARVAYLEALLTKDRADGDLAKKIWEAEQERDAANDYGEYVAIILNKVRQALGVPAEPHQGMPERILEAAEALAAHVERQAELLARLVAAMRAYEMDVDSDLPPPRDHRVMMSDAEAVLEAKPAVSLAAHDAELLNKPFEGLPGCSDGGCVVRKPTGMHTNGGCQCIRYQTASTIVQRLAALRDQRRQAEEPRS